MIPNPEISGFPSRQCEWKQDSIVVTPNLVVNNYSLTRLVVPVARDLPYRKIYVAAFQIPVANSPYTTDSYDTRFQLFFNSGTNLIPEMGWNWSNGVGEALPTTGQGAWRNKIQLHPQFRVQIREPDQPIHFGLNSEPSQEVFEKSFRIVGSAGTGLVDSSEILVSIAPFSWYGSLNSIEMQIEEPNIVGTNQSLVMIAACKSSAVLI